MKKSISVLYVLFVIITIRGHAQETVANSFIDNIRFGVKGGANFAALFGTFEPDAAYRLDAHLGIWAEKPLSEKIALLLEVQYSREGDGNQGIGSGFRMDNPISVSFINIPILAKFQIINQWSFELGLIPYITLENEDELLDVMPLNDEVTVIDNSFKTVWFGIAIGATYQFNKQWSGHFRFIHKPQSVLKVSNSELGGLGGGAISASILQFSIGYSFN